MIMFAYFVCVTWFVDDVPKHVDDSFNLWMKYDNENNSCKFIERCNPQWVNKNNYIRYYRRFANCNDGCEQAGSDVCPQCGCNEGYKPIFCFSNLVLIIIDLSLILTF